MFLTIMGPKGRFLIMMVAYILVLVSLLLYLLPSSENGSGLKIRGEVLKLHWRGR